MEYCLSDSIELLFNLNAQAKTVCDERAIWLIM